MTIFKKCTACEQRWQTRESFLDDPNTILVGYQINFEKLKLGFILFNHLSCKSTIAIPAGQFWALYSGPVYSGSKFGTKDCPEYCLHEDQLLPCPEQCECTYVREIIQIIREWPKHD